MDRIEKFEELRDEALARIETIDQQCDEECERLETEIAAVKAKQEVATRKEKMVASGLNQLIDAVEAPDEQAAETKPQ